MAVGMSVFGLVRLPKWKSRQFGTMTINWNKAFFASSGISFFVGTVVFLLSWNPWIAISIIPLAYMMVLGTVTDMKIMKIPDDISMLAYIIPVPIMLLCIDGYGWFSFGVWLGVVLLFLVFAFAGAFGVADLRIMLLAGTSVAWWAGAETVLLAFGASAFIQLAIQPMAEKFGWGVLKPRKTINDQVEEREKAEYEALSDEEKAVLSLKKADMIRVKVEKNKKRSRFFRKLQYLRLRKRIYKKRKRMSTLKRFVPFGPALYISFCAAAIIYVNMFAVYVTPSLSWIGL